MRGVSMGFEINDENKVRVALSKSAKTVISEDMRTFGIEKEGSIVNLILDNFHDMSRTSISKYSERVREKYVDIFNDSQLDNKMIQLAIAHIVKKETEKNSSIIQSYMSEKTDTKIYRINKKNLSFLKEEFEDVKFYKKKAGNYVKCILEEYARLPFMERVRIIRKNIFKEVEDAIAMNYLLEIKIMFDNKELPLIVYPYKIMTDPLNTQEYLACYTREKSESSKEKKCASFSMARLSKIKRLEQKSFLSKDDIKKLKTAIEELSVAYLLGEVKYIRVKLTEIGEKYYQTRLHMRPEKDSELSKDNIYVFKCSELQAYNYFYSFGAEATILEPDSLRARMKNNYEKALKSYQ